MKLLVWIFDKYILKYLFIIFTNVSPESKPPMLCSLYLHSIMTIIDYTILDLQESKHTQTHFLPSLVSLQRKHPVFAV